MPEELTNHSEEVTQETQETTQDTSQVENTTQQTEQVTPQTFKVKYNHQELELPYDEAVTHIQKGMNYDKAVERARQEARDAYIAEQRMEWNGKPITTEAEYRQALQEQEIMQKYQSQGLPEDVIAELVENKKFREQYQSKEKEMQEKADKEKQYQKFLEAYPDMDPATIDPSVWKAHQNGKNLLDAYQAWENQQLKAQLAEFQKGQQVQQANAQNAQTSTGSGKNTDNTSGFISKEEFEANRGNRDWVVKNLNLIEESRKSW